MQPPRLNRVPKKKAKLDHNQKPLKITSSEMRSASMVNADLLRQAPDIFARALIRGDISIRKSA